MDDISNLTWTELERTLVSSRNTLQELLEDSEVRDIFRANGWTVLKDERGDWILMRLSFCRGCGGD